MALAERMAKFGTKIVDSVGKNNRPVYAVVAVATANAIFKPLSTLMDKKESPETKKYTALREFLTECVAIPTYLACSWGAERFSKKFHNADRAAKAKSNLGFIGVCLAASIVIPAVCSVVIKPMTDMIYRRKSGSGAKKTEPAKVENKVANINVEQDNKQIYYPNVYRRDFSTFRNGGMRV